MRKKNELIKDFLGDWKFRFMMAKQTLLNH